MRESRLKTAMEKSLRVALPVIARKTMDRIATPKNTPLTASSRKKSL